MIPGATEDATAGSFCAIFPVPPIVAVVGELADFKNDNVLLTLAPADVVEATADLATAWNGA